MKAQEIAQTGRIVKTSKGWAVPSQSGNGAYIVCQRYLLAPLECECVDYQLHKHPCKHCTAVEIILKKETDAQGNVIITQTKKVTYHQNWKAYNTAQTSEIKQFDILLRDLTANTKEPEQHTGRPRLSLRCKTLHSRRDKVVLLGMFEKTPRGAIKLIREKLLL